MHQYTRLHSKGTGAEPDSLAPGVEDSPLSGAAHKAAMHLGERATRGSVRVFMVQWRSPKMIQKDRQLVINAGLVYVFSSRNWRTKQLKQRNRLPDGCELPTLKGPPGRLQRWLNSTQRTNEDAATRRVFLAIASRLEAIRCKLRISEVSACKL